MRFCFEITREFEKCVKLALGHFLSEPDGLRPRAFQSKARSHFPITALCFCLLGLEKVRKQLVLFDCLVPIEVVKLRLWGEN